jgi:hypothetical protein
MRGCFKDNPSLASLTREKLVAFFGWLQDGYLSEPDGAAPRGKIKLAPKSIANIHTNLSSFWSWAANEGFVTGNFIRTIGPPPFTPPTIEPFSKEDVSILLKACDSSGTWKTRPDIANRRPSAGIVDGRLSLRCQAGGPFTFLWSQAMGTGEPPPAVISSGIRGNPTRKLPEGIARM